MHKLTIAEFEMAKKVASDVGGRKKCLISYMVDKANPELTDPNDYWRITISIPFLDSIVKERNGDLSHLSDILST